MRSGDSPRPRPFGRSALPSEVLPLTLLAGLDRQSVADVGIGLLLRVPRLALIWADPCTAELGYIQTRVTDSGGRCTERTIELKHGCLSCALRDGVVAAVRGLAGVGRYDAVLVHLHPGVETDAAVAALHVELAGTAAVDTVVSVLPRDWLARLAGDQSTADAGIAVTPTDTRPAAVVLAANLRAATALVMPGKLRLGPTAEEHAALTLLTPGVIRMFPATALDIDPGLVLCTGAYDPAMGDRLVPRGLLDPHLPLPRPSGRLRLVRWCADRPVHPGRLKAALERLGDGVIRSTGHLWLATKAGVVVGWESAGGCLNVGPDGEWDGVEPSSGIGFLGEDLDAEHIGQVLDDCLLTDDEFAGGPRAWADLPDPFPDWPAESNERPNAQGAA